MAVTIRDLVPYPSLRVLRPRGCELAAPTPIRPATAHIEAALAASMPLADDTAHLIPTSPPYGVGVDEYADGGDVLADEWPAFMREWLGEALRVTAPSGRLALNVPLDTTKGGWRPTYAQAVTAAVDAGWTYRSTIVWRDGHLGKSVARGSLDSAAAPCIIAPVEMIALFSKGPWRRDLLAPSDLTRAEWLDWTNGDWPLRGETRPWEGHPAPFPREIPHRLIKLLSVPGDVVLDPFCGSGTTAVEAVRLGRHAIGFDRSPAYVESTWRRLAAQVAVGE